MKKIVHLYNLSKGKATKKTLNTNIMLFINFFLRTNNNDYDDKKYFVLFE